MARHHAVARPSAARSGHWVVRAALLACGIAVCAIWWSNTNAATLRTPGDAATAVGRVAGLVGAYLVLVQLMLLARLPWLERAVGLDRLAGWHRGLGTNVVILLCVHVLLVVIGVGLTDQDTPWSAVWEVLTTYPDIWLAVSGMALFLAVAITSGRALRARLSYEVWYWVHVLAYVGIALTFFHQISAGADFVVDPTARALWITMYCVVAACVLCWRVALPARRWMRHALTVERVVRETPDTVSIWLRGHALRELDAEPGQFFLWRFVTVGHPWTAHPYSLSAPATDRRMRITVKAAGDHSRMLAHLRRGVPVFAEGPFGHFTASARTRRAVLLIAGGSGIGPVRALAERLLAGGGDVELLYRASSWQDVALRTELDRMPGLRVRYLVGRRAELGFDPLDRRGLHKIAPDIAHRDVFVCGPAGMTAAVQGALRELGVPRTQIHTEEFSLR
jgi:predicted ferric reductase